MEKKILNIDEISEFRLENLIFGQTRTVIILVTLNYTQLIGVLLFFLTKIFLRSVTQSIIWLFLPLPCWICARADKHSRGYTHKHTWTTERRRKQKGRRAIFQAWLKPVKSPPHILLSWTAALHVLHVRYPSNRHCNAFVGKHSECQKETVRTNWDISLFCSEKTKNRNASSLLWKVDRQIGGEVWTIKARRQSKRECVSWGLGGRKETHSWCVVEKQHITSSR